MFRSFIHLSPLVTISLIFSVFVVRSAFSALRGESPTIIGDARQIGLSGASLGIADSVHTAIDNPANAHFAEYAVSLSLLNESLRDSRMNFDGHSRNGKGRGIVASSPRFGLFMAQRIPSQEFSTAGQVEVKETHYGAAMPVTPWLTLGAAVISARADWHRFNEPSNHASAWSVTFGARARVSENVLLGFAVRPSIPIQQLNHGDYRSLVEIPSRVLVGATILTETPFKFHFTTAIYGRQDDTVALNDPSVPAARAFSIQPRIGIEYTVFKNKLMQFDLYAGSYFEPARVEGLTTRTHYTTGAGLKVWAGRASIAYDRAQGYSNSVGTIGIDVLDLIVKLGVIPVPKNPEPSVSTNVRPEHLKKD